LAENETQGGWALPDGWVWTTIGEACEVNPRMTRPEQFDDDTLVSFVPMAAVDEVSGAIVSSEARPIGEVWRGYKRFAEGDVIFAKITPCMENGKAAIAKGLLNGIGLGSTEFHVLRTLDDILPQWIYHFVRQESFRGDAAARMTGTAGQLRVPTMFMQEAAIPLAPLPEQRRIVAEIETQFTRLDAAVAALERAQANLRRYKASVLKTACEGQLVPTEAALARAEGRDYEPADQLLARILSERRPRWIEAEIAKLERQGRMTGSASSVRGYKEPVPLESNDLPTLPDGWIWTSLDSLIYYTVDYRGKTPPSATNGVPIISAANVKDGELVFDKPRYISHGTYQEVLVRGVPEPEDLIITTEAPVGAVALFPDTGTYHLTRRVIGFQTLEVDNRYLMYCFYGDVTQKHLDKHSRGTTVPRILKPRLLATPIPLPPLAEQRRIVAEVERRLSVVAALERDVEAALARAARLRQAVLKQAFEGRLVPQDPDDEPASVLLERIRAQRKTQITEEGRRRTRQMLLPSMS